jgi:MFS family permease
MGHSPEGLALPEKDKTSIWLALKNPVFKRYWLAALVSGTCVAAHNTAAFTVLGQGDDSAILISLMSTLSSLPFALFTLPAGALADMAERKKILCATSTWQASIALCLAILALTNSLNPYVILISVFLFGIGFAFASPASASVEVEMVPPEHLASANTLGGLQMNIAGIIGPLIGGFLVSVSGPGSAFAANALGFMLLLVAISRWKRPEPETKTAPEDFFATIESIRSKIRWLPKRPNHNECHNKSLEIRLCFRCLALGAKAQHSGSHVSLFDTAVSYLYPLSIRRSMGEPAKPLASPASRSNCLISTFLAERLGFKRDFANGSTFCGLATENCGSGSWWKGHSSH